MSKENEEGPVGVLLMADITAKIAAWLKAHPIYLKTATVKPGCCDHKACCCKVVHSAAETFVLAANHYEQCCDEDPEPCSPDC